MRITLFCRVFVLLVVSSSLLACMATTPLVQISADSHLLLEDQQWVLWKQTEKMDEMAITQEALAKSLKDVQRRLQKLQKQVEKTQEVQVPPPAIEPNKEKASPSTPKTVHVMASTKEVTKSVIGRNEWVWLDLFGQTLKARIDTGALSSALHATNIQPFERNGKKWVRFSLSNNAVAPVFETPLVRYVRIRQASAEKLDRRPVVKLKIRVGSVVEETMFTLNDRDSMIYPVLLGRDFLRDIFVVDVSKKFTQAKYETSKLSK